MNFAVIRFPGSNCDQDCLLALNALPGATAKVVWHKDSSLAGFDAVIIPGGFPTEIICAAAPLPDSHPSCRR